MDRLMNTKKNPTISQNNQITLKSVPDALMNFLEELSIPCLFIEISSGAVIPNKALNKLNMSFGFEPNLRGKALITRYSEFIPKFTYSIQRVKSQQKEYIIEERFNVNLHEYIFEIRLIPYITAQSLDGIAIFFYDISNVKIIEEKLSRLTSVLRNFNRAILIVDFQGNIIAWDSGAELMYGWSESEALQMNIKQMTPPDKISDTQFLLDEIRYGVGFESYETQRWTKDGKNLYILTTSKPLLNERGERYGAAVTEYDITEQKLASLALKESEEKYRLITENLNAGIYRYCGTPNAIFLEANPAIIKMFGYHDKDEFLATEFGHFFLTPEEYDNMQFKIAKQGFLKNEEFKFRRKDGSEFWGAITAVAVYDKYHKIKYIDGVIQDITEQKQADLTLRSSEKRYRELIESLGEGIIVIDQSQTIILANPAATRIFGAETGELVGKSILEFLDPENQAKMPVLHKGKKFEKLYNQEIDIIQPGGHHRLLQFTFTQEPGTAEFSAGILAIFRDITDLRRMEMDMLKATKLESVGILAGGIAHDFNNILTIILGNISLCKLASKADASILKWLDKAENAGFRAKDLTQQLLTFSKGGAPVKKLASIEDVLKESVNFSLTGSNVKCQLTIKDVLWPMEFDEGQISQCINNLIINAVQAMPNGGTIQIKVQNTIMPLDNNLSLNEGKYIKITVEDQGIGIPEENLVKIFDPYFTTKSTGSGLGLASVYSIIKKHNGTITVKSTVGVGTRFDLYLPATEKVITKETELSDAIPYGTGHVLVMDDEEGIREIAKTIISGLGYTVSLAKDGSEAIKIYADALKQGKPIQVVVLDLTVPGGMGGKETISKLIKLDPAVKAIVVSGYNNDPIIAEYQRYGFSDVISKPFKTKHLANALHRITTLNK